jgi:phosphinothricin acetyltransferase
MIRPAKVQDAAALAAIYNHYIVKTIVTFEEASLSAEDMKARLDEVAAAQLPWLVAEEGGKVLGYAYASKWRTRSAYRYSVESSAYLAPEFVSRGWGTKLYTALFATLREKSIHAVIGGISLPNPASIALHEKFGMKKAAHFPEVGYKFKQWIDVGYWQATLAAPPNVRS